MSRIHQGKIQKISWLYLALIYVARPLLIAGLIAGSIVFNNDIMVIVGAVLFLALWYIRRMVFYLVRGNLDNRLLRAGYRFNYTYDDRHTSLYISSEQSLVIVVFDTNPFQYSVIHMDQVENPRVNSFITGKGRFEGSYQAAFEFDVEGTCCRVFTLESKKWLNPHSERLIEGQELAQKALDRMYVAQDYYTPPNPEDLPSADFNRFKQDS